MSLVISQAKLRIYIFITGAQSYFVTGAECFALTHVFKFSFSCIFTVLACVVVIAWFKMCYAGIWGLVWQVKINKPDCITAKLNYPRLILCRFTVISAYKCFSGYAAYKVTWSVRVISHTSKYFSSRTPWLCWLTAVLVRGNSGPLKTLKKPKQTNKRADYLDQFPHGMKVTYSFKRKRSITEDAKTVWYGSVPQQKELPHEHPLINYSWSIAHSSETH